MSGFFITFEGGEGGGKTTQLNWLAEYLTAQSRKVITTREPGGTPDAEKIRDLLVQREAGNWVPMAECLMMFAARALHVEKIIRPALEEGKTVISDRFTDSTIAYQGYGRGLDINKIKQLEALTLDGLKPDLTLILDIPPETGLERSSRRMAAESLGIKQTEDRFENMEIEFHKKLRQGFLDIATEEPERCIVINANQPPEAIRLQIQTAVDKAIG